MKEDDVELGCSERVKNETVENELCVSKRELKSSDVNWKRDGGRSRRLQLISGPLICLLGRSTSLADVLRALPALLSSGVPLSSVATRLSRWHVLQYGEYLIGAEFQAELLSSPGAAAAFWTASAACTVADGRAL